LRQRFFPVVGHGLEAFCGACQFGRAGVRQTAGVGNGGVRLEDDGGVSVSEIGSVVTARMEFSAGTGKQDR